MVTRASATDAELLTAWLAGDRDAGDALVARHYPRVKRFFELKASFAAEDLTQRTFVACVEQAAAFRQSCSFSAYLFAIARRQYLDHVRKSARRDAAMHRLAATDALATSLSVRIGRRRELMLLLRAMASLPEELLFPVQLYYWEGMPTAAIGEVMEIPQSTITTRLARARELLSRHLDTLAGDPGLRAAAMAELEEWLREAQAGERA